jgi:glutathione S-transferase
MAEVVIYGNPLSTYTRTARMALEEKGVAYELEPVDHRAPEFRETHPFGRIPALRHGDFVLYETMAICRYVDEAFDGPTLQPAEVRARALMVQWVSSTLDYFYPAMIRKLVFERLVAPAQGRDADEALVAESVPEIEHQADVLGRALDGRSYLAGEAASIADLFVFPLLFYVNFAPEGRAILAGAAALAAWLERMSGRASAQATMPPIDKL